MKSYIVYLGLLMSVNSFAQSLVESMRTYSDIVQNLDHIQMQIINMAYEEECSETPEYEDSSTIVNSNGYNYVENNQFQSLETDEFNLLISKPSKQMMLIRKSEQVSKNDRTNTIAQYLSNYSLDSDQIKSITHGFVNGQLVYHVSCSRDFKAETITFTFDNSSQLLTKMSVIYRKKEGNQNFHAKRVNTIINYELDKIDPIPSFNQYVESENGDWVLSEMYKDYSLTIHNM